MGKRAQRRLMMVWLPLGGILAVGGYLLVTGDPLATVTRAAAAATRPWPAGRDAAAAPTRSHPEHLEWNRS